VNAWIAVSAVGAGSYVLRVAPLVLLGRTEMPERMQQSLRHAGTAALAALVASGLLSGEGGGRSLVATACAVAATGALTWRGRALWTAVAAGTVVFALAFFTFRIV
jgi:branched-subunit amino acid transport protein